MRAVRCACSRHISWELLYLQYHDVVSTFSTSWEQNSACKNIYCRQNSLHIFWKYCHCITWTFFISEYNITYIIHSGTTPLDVIRFAMSTFGRRVGCRKVYSEHPDEWRDARSRCITFCSLFARILLVEWWGRQIRRPHVIRYVSPTRNVPQ